MNFAKLLLLLAAASNITAWTIYLRSIYKNKIKPHSFTFLVWSLILSINLLIQIFSRVGIGSLLIGTNLLGCVTTFIYCIKKGYINYDKIDLACLVLAIAAIIIWLITKNPLYAAILSCIIDLLAFAPSFRKSFSKPNEDSALTFIISAFEYIFSFPSYNIFSFLVLLYPVWVLSIDFAYAGMIIIRRMQLKPSKI